MQHLLLLHGAAGAGDQVKALADTGLENYVVHTLNFSGHGGRAFPDDPFSIELFAGDVLQYMDQHHILSASVFGYSMGGYVAMYLARYHPQKINKVVTLATKFYWDETVAAKEIKMLDAEIIQQKIPGFARQLQERHAPQDWKAVLDRTKELLLQLGRTNTLQLEDYPSVMAPCLLLIGDRDKMISLDETLAVYRQLADGQMGMLPGTGHPIEQVNLTMLSFLLNRFLG